MLSSPESCNKVVFLIRDGSIPIARSMVMNPNAGIISEGCWTSQDAHGPGTVKRLLAVFYFQLAVDGR